MGQMLSFSLPHAVPCVCNEDHRNLVFPIAVHQVFEALLGCWDRGPPSDKDPIYVKEEPKGAGALQEKGEGLIINIQRVLMWKTTLGGGPMMQWVRLSYKGPEKLIRLRGITDS